MLTSIILLVLQAFALHSSLGFNVLEIIGLMAVEVVVVALILFAAGVLTVSIWESGNDR